MRILQINCVYGTGSTGKITKDIHLALLKHGVESFVCYGRGKQSEDENVRLVSCDAISRVRKMIASLDGIPYGFTRWTNGRLEEEIEQIHPDIIHLQCINGYFVDIYRLLNYLKKKKYPTILTLHAEFMHTGGCGYALDCNQWIDGCQKCERLKSGLGVAGLDQVKRNYRNMQHAIGGFDNLTVVGVSDWISGRAKRSRIMSNCRVITIHNGIDTSNIFFPKKEEQIKKTYKIPQGKQLVLSVVPNLTSDLKGGKLMMELARDMQDENYFFIVVGAKEKVQDAPQNMRIIPYTESQDELAEIYSTADVFVMGSKMDNYPTVCIEANSCGTPVVGFDVGGVSETIFPEMGCTVPYGDISVLKDSIRTWAKRKGKISDETIKQVIWRNSKERMCEDYLNLYRESVCS